MADLKGVGRTCACPEPEHCDGAGLCWLPGCFPNNNRRPPSPSLVRGKEAVLSCGVEYGSGGQRGQASKMLMASGPVL